MSKKYYIFSERNRLKLQEETVRRVIEAIKGPVSLYEDLPDKGPDFRLTDSALKAWRPFCRLVWEDKKRKEKCLKDHRKRAAACTDSQIICCWAGVHNAACRVQDDQGVSVTFIGGMYRISERYGEVEGKLQALLESVHVEQQDRFRQAWNNIPQVDEARFREHHIRELEQAGLDYLHALRQRSEIQYLSTQLTHDVINALQALLAEIELLKLDMKHSFDIGKKWEDRFDAIMETCEKHTLFLETKLESEKSRYQYDSISKLIYEVFDPYRPIAQKRNIEFRIDLEQLEDHDGKHKVLEVRMDSNAIGQALRNVIDNAVKYSFAGTSRQPRWIGVNGRLYTQDNIEGYLLVVTNLGVGVEEDELEAVFDPLYQGRLRINEDRPGYGMGLTFVKNVIEDHGGSVELQSYPGRRTGWLTKVSIWLPLQGPS